MPRVLSALSNIQINTYYYSTYTNTFYRLHIMEGKYLLINVITMEVAAEATPDEVVAPHQGTPTLLSALLYLLHQAGDKGSQTRQLYITKETP